MSSFIAQAQFSIYSFNLSTYFYAPGASRLLIKNANVEIDGVGYVDAYWTTAYRTGQNYQFSVLGSGFSVDAAGLLNDGAVNRLQEVDQTSNIVRWSLSDVALDAAAISFAAQSGQNFDDLSLLSIALAGDDHIILSSFADDFNAFGGNDFITGGLGSDFLSGGGGDDTFIDTLAGLNNDTLADFGVGDSIVFTDADLATFSFSLDGSTITFTGGRITLGTAPTLALVASQYPGGGVRLSLQEAPTLIPAGPPHADFNGDGRSDVAVLDAQNNLTIWKGQSNGSFAPVTGLAANALDSNWKIVGLGDFNGDGKSDILWRHSSGEIGEWLGHDGVFTNNGGAAANPVDNVWAVIGVADYNGDGRDDILWRATNGEVGQWISLSNGGFANNGGAAANLVDNSWKVVASGDFNGDGKADILWQHSSGVYAEWQGTATGKLINVGQVMTGATGAVVGSGDFNGDGRDDILVRDTTSGQITIWQGSSTGQLASYTPALQLTDLSYKVAAISDFNGDGIADLLWTNSAGQTVEWLGSASGQFANNGAALTLIGTQHIQSPDLFAV